MALRRVREQALFCSFHLLAKLPSIRQFDVVLSEHLSRGAAAKDRTRSFLVQVMDGFIESLPKRKSAPRAPQRPFVALHVPDRSLRLAVVLRIGWGACQIENQIESPSCLMINGGPYRWNASSI
jgi:hypothetical protein